MTGLLPSSAAAQYTDYTRQLLEQQKRIQQQRIQQQKQNQQRQQRYVPPANQSRQRGNTNNSNYWLNLQRQQKLQQQRKRQAERRRQQVKQQRLEQWRREQAQKRQRLQRQQQRRTSAPTRTTRTPVRRTAPRKKAAGYSPEAAAAEWRRRQKQRSQGKTRPRATGNPTGITTNRARTAGRGASTGTTRRGGGGIEAGGSDDIRMRGVVRRKPAPSNPKFCDCRGGDNAVYGAICYGAKGTYRAGNFPWTPQCGQNRITRTRGRR
jgi:hypothetical protein